MPCAFPSLHAGRDGRLRLGTPAIFLDEPLPHPRPARAEVAKSARGAETGPVGGQQKSHDAPKGCSVIRSVGLGEHFY